MKMMMPFFNWNWAGAHRGRWAGPELLTNWAVGCWIVWAGGGLLQRRSAGFEGDASLQEQERRGGGGGGGGVGGGVARSCSDA